MKKIISYNMVQEAADLMRERLNDCAVLIDAGRPLIPGVREQIRSARIRLTWTLKRHKTPPVQLWHALDSIDVAICNIEDKVGVYDV